MNIYCISGLGADHQIFDHLKLPDEIALKHIRWIKPLPQENLQSYAERMADRIKDDNPILMGVSFGGMMSIEISKIRNVRKIILISSIKSTYERPLYFKIVAGTRINRLVSLKPRGLIERVENYNLGVRTDADKTLAHSYRKKYDANYVDWAIERIVHWKNKDYPSNIFHIHGSKDHIFPIKYVQPSKVIQGGGHLMVYNKPDEVSDAILEGLETEGLL